MKITDVITEAASPAQQAAIPTSMKKAGKKPRSVDEDLTRRGFLRGLGAAAVAGAAGSALAGTDDLDFPNKVQKMHSDMMEKNPRYAKEHEALGIALARGFVGAAAENNKRWYQKTAELLQKYGVKVNEGVAEGASNIKEKIIKLYKQGLSDDEIASRLKIDSDDVKSVLDDYEWVADTTGEGKGVAEGAAETVPMQYAQKVLNHYGADYFKTTHDTLYFSKYRKQFSIGRIRDDDSASAGSVNLSDLNAMVRKLRGMRVPLSPFGEGVAEDHEIQMASSELESIAKNAVRLLALVRKYSEQQGLDAWQQSKITKAADYLNSVLQAVSGEQTSLEGVGMPFRGVGGAFNRGDDERHDLDMPEQDPREFRKYNLTINGKPLNPQPITGRSNLIKWGREHAASGVDLSNAVISLVDEDAYMESLTNMLERSVSQAQHNLMVGVANNPQFAQKVKVKQNVGQEFANADQGHDISKLPIRVPKKK